MLTFPTGFVADAVPYRPDMAPVVLRTPVPGGGSGPLFRRPNLFQSRLQLRRKRTLDPEADQSRRVHAADVHPILIAVEAELHLYQIGQWNHWYFSPVDFLDRGGNRRIRRRLTRLDALPAEQ